MHSSIRVLRMGSAAHHSYCIKFIIHSPFFFFIYSLYISFIIPSRWIEINTHKNVHILYILIYFYIEERGSERERGARERKWRHEWDWGFVIVCHHISSLCLLNKTNTIFLCFSIIALCKHQNSSSLLFSVCMCNADDFHMNRVVARGMHTHSAQWVPTISFLFIVVRYLYSQDIVQCAIYALCRRTSIFFFHYNSINSGSRRAHKPMYIKYTTIYIAHGY